MHYELLRGAPPKKVELGACIAFLIFGVPLFFPLLLWGKLPGPFQVGLSDTFAFFEPFTLEFTRAIKSDGSPFWSHLSSFGSPAFLPLGTGVTHPFNAFHLFLPNWLAFVLGWWARIALFGVFTFLYLFRSNVPSWLALYFTLGLTYGSFFLNYGYEIIGYVICFFPMALYYADKLCRRTSMPDFCLLAVAIAGILLGGFPSVIFYLYIFLGVYILAFSRTVKTFCFAALACMCGLLLLLPVIHETFSFYRSADYSAEQRAFLFFYDPPAQAGLNMIIPSVYGNLMDHAAAGQRDFFGSRLGFGVIGAPLILSFGIFLCIKRAVSRRTVFWLLVCAACFIMYFNIFSVKKLIAHVPLLNEHPLTRLQTLIAFSGTITAALLTERMLQLQCEKSAWARCLLGAGAVLIGFFLIAVISQTGGKVLLYCTLFTGIGLFSLAALYFCGPVSAGKNAKAYFLASGLLVALSTSAAYSFYFTPKDYYPASPLSTAIQGSIVPGARILDVGNTLFKYADRAYGLSSITNHWFAPQPVRQWVFSLTDAPSAGLTFDSIGALKGADVWPKLRAMHVQFVVVPLAQLAQLHPSGEGKDWELRLDHNHLALVEVLYDGARLDRTSMLSGNGYRAYSEGGGNVSFAPLAKQWITLPVRYYPGWTAVSGTAEVRRSGNGLMEVLPAAAGQPVSLVFFPLNLYLLLAAGVGGALLCLMMGIALHRMNSTREKRT